MRTSSKRPAYESLFRTWMIQKTCGMLTQASTSPIPPPLLKPISRRQRIFKYPPHTMVTRLKDVSSQGTKGIKKSHSYLRTPQALYFWKKSFPCVSSLSRMERDSNPRYSYQDFGFQDRLFQPLRHPSSSRFARPIHPRAGR